MPKQVTFYAALVSSAMIGSCLAQPAGKPNDMPMPPLIDLLEYPTVLAGNEPEIVQEVTFKATEFRPAQLGELPWFGANTQIVAIDGAPGAAVPFTAKVKFAANTKISPHSHSGVERVTVLSGVLNIGMGDRLDANKTSALAPGSVRTIQPEANHFVWFDQETVIQLHGVWPWTVTYVNPDEDPRRIFAPRPLI